VRGAPAYCRPTCAALDECRGPEEALPAQITRLLRCSMVSASSQVISQVVISPKAAHLCAISNCRHNRWVLGRHEEGLDASCKGRTKAEDGRRGRGRMSGDNSTKATHEARLLRKALRLPYTSLLPRQPSATKLSQKRLCQVYWSNGCYTGCSQN